MRLLQATLVALLLAACSNLKVTSQANPSADLTRYRAYAWAPTSFQDFRGTGYAYDPSLDRQIKSAVEVQLAKQGFTPATNPDFFVIYQVTTQDRVGFQDGPSIDRDSFGSQTGYWNPSMDTYQYRQGTIHLEFFDPQTNQVFWHGTATAILDDPRAINDEVASAVKRMLAQYLAA